MSSQDDSRRRAQIELATLHQTVVEELDSATGWQFGNYANINDHLILDDLLSPPRRTYSSRQRTSTVIRRSASLAQRPLSSLYDVPSERQSIPVNETFSLDETLEISPKSPIAPADSSIDSTTSKSPAKEPEVVIVGWDGENDPENPYNWPAWRVNLNASLLIFLAFLIPLASSIVAPAVPQIMLEFQNDSLELAALVVSVFVLGLGIGPLLFAPLSEIYGRLIIYHICNVGFTAFHAACARAPSLSALIAFRFLAGFFGSCALTNGGGSFADMIPPERRGSFLGAFAVGPLLGPVIGPVAGGFLGTARGWRWVFWLTTMIAGATTIATFALGKETFGPVILQRKARRLRAATGNPNITPRREHDLAASDVFKLAIVRPLKLLVLSPVSILSALYVAVVYGYQYLMFSSITDVFTEQYGFASNLVGLVFLGFAVGSLVGIPLIGLMSDRAIKRQMLFDGDKPEPETRITLVPVGGVLLPIGFFVYGWTADYNVHWIVPIIGLGIIGLGTIIIFMSTILYLIDAFGVYAASALAANTLVRSLGGGFLPLAGLRLYRNLGVGWGNSVLGFIAVAFIPVGIAFNRYGGYLRKRFKVVL